jgi:hypothetical protein
MQDWSSTVAITRYISRTLRHVCGLRLKDRQTYDDNSRLAMSLIFYTNLRSGQASGKPIRPKVSHINFILLLFFFSAIGIIYLRVLFNRWKDTLYACCSILSDLHICMYTYDYMLVVPPLLSTKKVSMDHNNDVALNFYMKIMY